MLTQSDGLDHIPRTTHGRDLEARDGLAGRPFLYTWSTRDLGQGEQRLQNCTVNAVLFRVVNLPYRGTAFLRARPQIVRTPGAKESTRPHVRLRCLGESSKAKKEKGLGDFPKGEHVLLCRCIPAW